VNGGFLVVRRGGATWAVAHQEVQGLAGRGAGFVVRVAAGALAADEVLGVTVGLRLHPAGGVLRRFWPEAARGLAVHGTLPLVLIDALAPPRALLEVEPPPLPSSPSSPSSSPARDAEGVLEEGSS